MKVGTLTAQSEVAIRAIVDAIRTKAEEHAGEAAALALLGDYRGAHEYGVRSEECDSLARAVTRALHTSVQRAPRTITRAKPRKGAGSL